MYTRLALLLLPLCICGCVAESLINIPPDPPLAKAQYKEQSIGISKPNALEFWVASPRHNNHPWNIIRMWFPEAGSIKDSDGKLIWNLTMPQDPAIWKYAGRGLRAECDIPEGGKFTRTVKRNGSDAIDLTMSFQNDSSVVWKQARAGSCLQLSSAADYEDNTGKRTYWVLDGVSTPTYQMAITSPGMRGTSGVGQNVRMKDGTERKVTEGAAFIVSKDGKYVLGYSWQPAVGLFYNRAGIVACVHVQPSALDVPAGQTRQLKGIIFIHEGNIQEAFERYVNWKKSLSN